MINENLVALNKVAAELGLVDAIELFEFALPIVIERQQMLQNYLQAEDWVAAAQCAHKTISSVRFYSSERLEGLLRQAMQVRTGEIDVAILQQALFAEFDAVISTVREWLSTQAC